jgi:hypothetical protein
MNRSSFPVNRPWLLAGVLLIGGSAWFWADRAKLLQVREDQRRLVEQARALGLDPDQAPPRDGREHAGSRRRMDEADRSETVKALAVKLAALAKEMERIQRDYGRMSSSEQEALQQRTMKIISEMLRLDASQLKALIAELRADFSLDEEMKREMVGFTIQMLAADHPATALLLVADSKDLFDKGQGEHVVASALSRWAQDDPAAALAWMKANAEAHPEWVTEQTKRGLVVGAARQDPKFALQLVGELGLTGTAQVGRQFAAAVLPENRLEVMAMLRQPLPGVTDEKAREQLREAVIEGFAQQSAKEGFAQTSAWLDRAALHEKETLAWLGGLNADQTKDETGRWIDWAAGRLPAEKLSEPVGFLVRDWTREDYKAAGEWINATADGPVKQAAVRSYAETVAPYDPQTAAQWAESLPAGKDRDQLLRKVRDEWKQKDEAAAAEFARKNGVK